MVHTKDTLGWLPALAFEASDNSKKYRIDFTAQANWSVSRYDGIIYLTIEFTRANL